MKTLENLNLTQIQHDENYLLVISHPDTFTPDIIKGTGKELIDFIFENEDSLDEDEMNLPEIEKLELIDDRHNESDCEYPALNLFKVK